MALILPLPITLCSFYPALLQRMDYIPHLMINGWLIIRQLMIHLLMLHWLLMESYWNGRMLWIRIGIRKFCYFFLNAELFANSINPCNFLGSVITSVITPNIAALLYCNAVISDFAFLLAVI